MPGFEMQLLDKGHGWMITSKQGLGIGVVVPTNSDDGLLVVYDVAQRALGGTAYWRYF